MLTCAIAKDENGLRAVIGARPGKAVKIELAANSATKEIDNLKANAVHDSFLSKLTNLFIVDIKQTSENLAKTVKTSSNMRASSEYRSHLVKILSQRGLKAVLNMPPELGTLPDFDEVPSSSDDSGKKEVF